MIFITQIKFSLFYYMEKIKKIFDMYFKILNKIN